MGAAWCRDKAAKAKDSKSPIDRVIVKCVNQMSLSERPVTNNVVQGPAKYPRLHLSTKNRSAPDPVRPNPASEWQDVDLKVPDPPERTVSRAPVPPPRKKRTNVASIKQDEGTQKTVKETEAPKPRPVPTTPVIYLEVDTPTSKHREWTTPVLDKEPESSPELKHKTAVETSPRRSTSSMCLSGTPNRADSEVDMLQLPKRSVSSMSQRSASPVSEATAERVDNYLKSCRSFSSLRQEELLDELNQALSDTGSEDSWAGLDDWDLGIVDHHGPTGMSPPVTPTSQLPAKSPSRNPPKPEFTLGEPTKKKKKRDKKEREERKLKREAKREKNMRESKQSGKDLKLSGRDSLDDAPNIISPPANFQADAKSYNKGSTSLIKPSQISVQDFLRQSNNNNNNNDNNNDSMAKEFGKLSVGLPVLRIDVPSENSNFSFDYSKGLLPPRSPQIEIPGTPSTPRGLSRCSSPLPSMFMNSVHTTKPTTTPPSSPNNEDEENSWTEAKDDTTVNLMRILQEYHLTADVIGDRDAKKILQELGIPVNLIDEIPELHKENDKKPVETDKITVPDENGSSGLSSMTPSLTELEASLSELLEASAANGDDDEIEKELKSQLPQVVSVPTMLTENQFKPITLTDSSSSHKEEISTVMQDKEKGRKITKTLSQETAVSTTTTVEEITHIEITSQIESKIGDGKTQNLLSLVK